MGVEGFPQEVVSALGSYVYRLIDPRNGETFYVGKGKEQRVFDHARGVVGDPDQYSADPKVERIHEIRALGMDVQHIIHRHGMSDTSAREVEAALIDAYPGLFNRVSGSGSNDRGTRHVNEIVQEYSAEEFLVRECLILISIGQLWRERGVYGAVRGLWKLNIERAENYKLVLAHIRGVVRGAYRPQEWLMGTAENFPLEGGQIPKRIGFEGKEAEQEVWDAYVGKRVPATYRKRGAQAPCRYLSPS